MRSWWRFWLVWLMVLAVPVQGMAGVAMQHCKQVHGQAGHAVAVEVRHGHAPAHQHRALPAAADPAAVAQVSGHVPSGSLPIVAGMAGMADAAGQAQAPVANVGHDCSACAACCAALGLPTWSTPLPMPTVAAVADLLSLVTINSFVPAGPERPPRFPLA